MKLKDVLTWWRLRRHIREPWRFVRRRKNPANERIYDVQFLDGGAFTLRNVAMDRHTFVSVFAKDIYRLDGVASLGTVIDVGAHIGTFAARVAPLATRVLCFEPMPDNLELLRRNVARFPHVEVHAAAIGASRGRQRMFASSNPVGHSLIASQAEGAGGAVEVELRTLEDVIVERCGLLKLNCEGAEYAILYGLPAALWGRIDRAVTAYHAVKDAPAEWTGPALARHIERMGHRVEVARSREPGMGRIYSWKS